MDKSRGRYLGGSSFVKSVNVMWRQMEGLIVRQVRMKKLSKKEKSKVKEVD
jgi:hypothetical protein